MLASSNGTSSIGRPLTPPLAFTSSIASCVATRLSSPAEADGPESELAKAMRIGSGRVKTMAAQAVASSRTTPAGGSASHLISRKSAPSSFLASIARIEAEVRPRLPPLRALFKPDPFATGKIYDHSGRMKE